MRKLFLLVVMVVALFSATAFVVLAQTTSRPLVGVIRYNQFYHANDPDLASLNPAKWHDRIPWCLGMTDNSVYGDCNSQAEFDRDMLYAITAKIDYFAHLDMGPGKGNVDKVVAYHMASKYKQQVKFSVIIHIAGASQEEDANVNEWADNLVTYFKDPSYQTVLNGRPLIFILKYSQKIIDAMQLKTEAAGLPTPYIVSMFGGGPGTDGFSAYMFTGTGLGDYQGNPFAMTMDANIRSWNSSGADFIPNVTLGNDQRPRWGIPPPWGAFANPWFEQPTTAQITSFVGAALDFVKQNPKKPNSILIYAWDEVAEGGWLIPTHTEGDARVRALGDFLSKYGGCLLRR